MKRAPNEIPRRNLYAVLLWAILLLAWFVWTMLKLAPPLPQNPAPPVRTAPGQGEIHRPSGRQAGRQAGQPISARRARSTRRGEGIG
jgi:hypothetical protein